MFCSKIKITTPYRPAVGATGNPKIVRDRNIMRTEASGLKRRAKSISSEDSHFISRKSKKIFLHIS